MANTRVPDIALINLGFLMALKEAVVRDPVQASYQFRLHPSDAAVIADLGFDALESLALGLDESIVTLRYTGPGPMRSDQDAPGAAQHLCKRARAGRADVGSAEPIRADKWASSRSLLICAVHEPSLVDSRFVARHVHALDLARRALAAWCQGQHRQLSHRHGSLDVAPVFRVRRRRCAKTRQAARFAGMLHQDCVAVHHDRRVDGLRHLPRSSRSVAASGRGPARGLRALRPSAGGARALVRPGFLRGFLDRSDLGLGGEGSDLPVRDLQSLPLPVSCTVDGAGQSRAGLSLLQADTTLPARSSRPAPFPRTRISAPRRGIRQAHELRGTL